MRAALWGLLLICTVSPARADAPTRSLFPEPRPQAADAVQAAPMLRPLARPTEAAARTEPAKPRATRKGSVCKNNNIKGIELEPITSRTKGCSVAAPVQVSSINGVRLSPAATINCNAAEALATWIDDGLQPAFQGQIVQLNVADSYSCRPRNNVSGGRISEHGLGNAIYIEAFVLKSGKTLTVESNYGRQIRAAHKAACGTFHTTLGPGSDGYHEDHIHFDVSQRGGRAFCR
jgi:hypothetical protein